MALESESKVIDFNRWPTVKRRLNLLINTAVFEYLSQLSDHHSGKLSEQFVVEAISEMLLYHYKKRLILFKICDWVPFNRRMVFALLSLLLAYFQEINRFIFSVSKLRYYYKPINQNFDKKINIVLGFPRHAFSIQNRDKNNKSQRMFSSFGEYLNTMSQKGELFSVYEYVRPSKVAEKHIELNDNNVKEYPRKKISPGINWRIFFYRIIKLIYHYIKIHPSIPVSNFLLKIIYVRKWFFSFDYKNIVKAIGVTEDNIEAIYVLPHADTGLLNYNGKETHKIIIYNYAANVIGFPGQYFFCLKNPILRTELKNILADIPLSAFKLNGYPIGFTDIFSQLDCVRQALNDYMGCLLPLPNFIRETQIPMLLGYESLSFNHSNNLPKNCVAIFDDGPNTRREQLSMSLMGNRVSDYEAIEEFLLESVNTCILMGFSVLIKPKYSLSNYDDRYQSLINRLHTMYEDKVIIVNPYIRMELIMKTSEYCINLPYTSTKLVADGFDTPSVYYMPIKYKDIFIDGCKNQNIIFGKEKLKSFLRS